MGICQTITNSREPTKGRESEILVITAITWERESHGLFDYESTSVVKNSFNFTGTAGSILRAGTTTHLLNSNDPAGLPESAGIGAVNLLNLRYQEGEFHLVPLGKKAGSDTVAPPQEDQDDSTWLVVKYMIPNYPTNINGHVLAEGDYIKLGRVKFRVKVMRSEANPGKHPSPAQKPDLKAVTGLQNQATQAVGGGGNPNVTVNASINQGDVTPGGTQKEIAKDGDNDSVRSVIACRICLENPESDDNPFIAPCSCAGSVKYVHVKCLQYWLSSKLTTKHNNAVTSIIWKVFECELCKKAFPPVFNCNNRRYDAIEIPIPNSRNYIIFEQLSKEKNQPKGYHIMDLDAKSNIQLGRGHNNDVRITDISVSRHHASIVLDKGNIVLQDANSKFGTLLKAVGPVPIISNGDISLAVQVGRTVCEFTLKKTWRIFPICYSNESEVENVTELVNNDRNNAAQQQREREQMHHREHREREREHVHHQHEPASQRGSQGGRQSNLEEPPRRRPTDMAAGLEGNGEEQEEEVDEEDQNLMEENNGEMFQPNPDMIESQLPNQVENNAIVGGNNHQVQQNHQAVEEDRVSAH